MKIRTSRFLLIWLLALAGTTFLIAQDKTPSGDMGKVRVSVLPEEAYIWVDDKPVSHRSSTLKLPPGEHKIAVYNYGYLPDVHNVTVASGQLKEVNANLQPVHAAVSGPWGRIQIEGVPGDALVFLNGTTPEFFVGHADEMNNNIYGEQKLIVPVGTQQVHVLANKTDQEIWAGAVEVKQNERVIIYTKDPPDKQLVYKRWPEGAQLNGLKRFEAGTATATIAVAPVKGKIALDRQNVNCDEPVKVSWDTTDAAHVVVKENEKPIAYANTGAVEKRPHQNTKYEFHAAGPGGIVTSEATVNVDTNVKASLTPTAPEMRYVKVGDKVQEQGSTELRWTVANADSVKIDPIGTVNGQSGSQTIQANPSQNGSGKVDETVTYKLTATNVCGGSATTTASVHVTGSIEPEQQEVASAEPAPQLPETASLLPLITLLGASCLGVAGMLKKRKG
jgi:hypothetical protein